jgi:hypothetical protein
MHRRSADLDLGLDRPIELPAPQHQFESAIDRGQLGTGSSAGLS